jgi:hypothetical protein
VMNFERDQRNLQSVQLKLSVPTSANSKYIGVDHAALTRNDEIQVTDFG